MKTRSIFISRTLKSSSAFLDLNAKGCKVIHRSLIDFEFLNFNNEVDFQNVFFYSQKAIKHFFSKVSYNSKIEYGVMGQKSQLVFHKETGQDPNIIGTGDRQSLIKNIETRWKGTTVLCPMGSNSIHMLSTSKLDIDLHPLIIYNNTKIKFLDLPDCEILIFTSPLNVESYCDHYSLDNKILFAIGETTANKIKKHTDQNVIYCSEPSEQSLYKLVDAYLR